MEHTGVTTTETVVKPLEHEVEITGWRRTFISLAIRDYRWYFIGMLASTAGMQIQIVARGWLVWEMTGSAAALGIITFASGVPMTFLSLVGGVVADRVQKRNLLMAADGFVGLVSLITALLIAFDLIELWHLIAAAVSTGIAFAFKMPGRQAFLPELAGEKHLMNAVALNSAGMNFTRIAVPGIAGVLIGVIGVANTYFLIVVGYVLAVSAVLMIPASRSAIPKLKGRAFSQFAEGIRYIKRSEVIPILLGFEIIVVFFAMQYQTLMPVFADKVLGVGASGMGFMYSAVGIGGLIGSLFVASLGDFRRRGLLLVGAAASCGALLILYSAAGIFYPALVLLALVGLANMIYNATNNTVLMSNTNQEVRGRVMSVYLMGFGLQPLGALPMGAVADAIGAPLTVGIGSGVLLLFSLGMAVVKPKLRRLE